VLAKKADHPLGLREGTIGDQGAQGQVFLAGIVVKEGFIAAERAT